jgi:hypothetical protein
MALVVFDRVQETTATTGTGTITLGGAVTGYQSFAVVGDGNTTFYCITNGSQWEVGIGTYTLSGTTLARTTILSNSNGNTSPITLVGASNVFVTYPAGKSVNLNASGNVTALGTITSGVWNGTTIPVAYGGTGVTSSSGADSVVLRDANQNIAVNRVNQANTTTTAAGGTTALTAASTYIHSLVGTGGQTYTLPDATTLATGVAFLFNNLATGTLTIQNFAAGAIGTIPTGGAGAVFLTNNGTTGGTWDLHAYLPEGVTFGTNAFNLGTAIVSGGTWQGGTIQSGYGGTGLTTFAAANNALYSTSASALTAGTLPVAAGGTGATTLTSNGVLYGTGTAAISATAVGSTGQVLVGNTGAAPSWATVSSSLVSSFNAGTTGFTPSSATTGAVTLAGTLNVANGGTGTATAFTAGSVLFAGASGTYSQDNANLFWDDANNRLGIGTASPTAGFRLDIRDATARQRIESTTGTNEVQQRYVNTGGTLFVGIDSSTGAGFGANYGAQFWHNGNYPILFGTNNQERMRIDSAGLVGIGAAPISPYRLNVSGNLILGAAADITPTVDWAGQVTVTANGYAGGLAFDATGMWVGHNSSTRELILATNETARMRITSDGKVLIGTATAGTTGTGITVFNDTQPEVRLQTTSSGTGTLNGMQLALGVLDYYQWNFEAGAQIFGTSNTEAMRINSTGEVGIGTTASGIQLSIDAGSNNALQTTQTGLTAVQFTSTDASASGMNIQYFKDSASPAASDNLSLVRTFGRSSTGVQREYGRVTTGIASATNAAEAGSYVIAIISAGALSTKLQLNTNSIRAIEAYTLTTGSSANMNVDTAGVFARSTSSIRYKTQVEDLAEPNSANIYNMRPVWYRSTCDKDNKNWSYYGLIAEELAELDPRLVHWGYTPDQYDTTYVENDGQKEEVKTLKEDAELQPEGVQYDRLTVLLIQEMKALKAQVEAQALEIEALKAGQ